LPFRKQSAISNQPVAAKAASLIKNETAESACPAVKPYKTGGMI